MNGAPSPPRRRAHLSWAIPLVLSFLLLSLGTALAYGSYEWRIRMEYLVTVDTPDDVTWSVWAPRPNQTLLLDFLSAGTTVANVSTVHGEMLNLTGQGHGAVRYAWYRFFYGHSPSGLDFAPRITGGNGTAHWVHRESSQSTTWMSIGGETRWTGTHLGSQIHCGYAGYMGGIEAGWTLVPDHPGSCLEMGTSVVSIWAAIPLLGAGAICGGLAWDRWRRGGR